MWRFCGITGNRPVLSLHHRKIHQKTMEFTIAIFPDRQKSKILAPWVIWESVLAVVGVERVAHEPECDDTNRPGRCRCHVETWRSGSTLAPESGRTAVGHRHIATFPSCRARSCKAITRTRRQSDGPAEPATENADPERTTLSCSTAQATTTSTTAGRPNHSKRQQHNKRLTTPSAEVQPQGDLGGGYPQFESHSRTEGGHGPGGIW